MIEYIHLSANTAKNIQQFSSTNLTHEFDLQPKMLFLDKVSK